MIEQLQEIITEVRRFRNDQGIKTSAKIPGRFIASSEVSAYVTARSFVLRLEPGDFNTSASLDIGDVTVEFDLTGSIDIPAERARLSKDLATAQKDLATAQVKLNNEGFMAKAPEEVVVEIRERLLKTSADIERISAQLASMPLA